MDNKQKFTLSDCTQEELQAFMADFDAVCEKHSVQASTQPRYETILVKDDQGKEKAVSVTVVGLVVNKKTPIESVVAEKAEGEVESTNTEVNPAI